MKTNIMASFVTGILLSASLTYAQFTEPTSGGQTLPTKQGFNAEVGTSIIDQAGFSVDAGKPDAVIQAGSLSPSNPAVAATLAPGEGNHLKITPNGTTSSIGWYLGNAISNKNSVVYISFLIQSTELPYNGEVIGLRRHATGGGTVFQLRGDQGKQKGGTHGQKETAFMLRPAKTDTTGTDGQTKVMNLDGTTTYFVVMKCEATPDFSSDSAKLTMTTWLDPDPSAPEAEATIWQKAAEQESAKNIRWLSIGAHKEKGDYAIDEIRIGETWDSVTPTK